ncbi:MAG: 2-oxoacid:ferredoxin oxidoreductase subunit beta [Myxococcales bacterium]|nr:2-oxoacid:ferredoxin oxidoreductase subunit beta [Myxococcales bacterium]
MSELVKLSKKDFQSDQQVRWCPGCGDFAILSAVQAVLPTLGIPKEKFVVVSGIGCSSRFPYYMNTYGFHSIHGRAPALASGIKIANPELSVWIATGDGDSLSIGGNHLLHLIRRNMDVNLMLFNNRIYGLTKGQYSPTSEVGKRAKSTPYGSLDRPVNPISLVLGAGATFVARSIDVYAAHLRDTLTTAHGHAGTSFIEILQNCNIFNDGTWDDVREAANRAETTIELKHGEPLIFGKDRDKGIVFDQMTPRVVALGNGITEGEIARHDERGSLAYHVLLAEMTPPHFPLPLGVIRNVEAPVYDRQLRAQIESVTSQRGAGDLKKLLNSGQTWRVE